MVLWRNVVQPQSDKSKANVYFIVDSNNKRRSMCKVVIMVRDYSFALNPVVETRLFLLCVKRVNDYE